MAKFNEGLCEMCGHFVSIRQKAQIISEKSKKAGNVLNLCPTCYIMFDTKIKPALHKSLKNFGSKPLPASWNKSIYIEVAEPFLRARRV